MMQRHRSALFILVSATACAGPTTPNDAGAVDGSMDSGPIEVCDHDEACGDQSLFCARWRCRPGDPGTDARGCIDLGPPCDPGACNEALDSCGTPSWCTDPSDGCAAPGDCDGDGARAIECSGDDCDDHDGTAYPGNAETCDPEGHDEDCDATTFGDVDADGDGSISAACCNGTACGDDCEDDDSNINPGAAEVCDARDNDCDSVVDGDGAFCPRGLCVERRCRATNWERVVDGTSSWDGVLAIVADASGNAYALVSVPDGADLDDDTVAEPGGQYVVSIAPDGRVRWVGAVVTAGQSIAVAPDGSVVVPSGTSLVRFDPADGTTTTAVDLTGLSAEPSFAVVRSSMDLTVVGMTIDSRIHVIVFDERWVEMARLVTPSAGSPTVVHDIGVSDAGIALTGETSVDFTLGAHAVTPGRFVLKLGRDLSPMWGWHLPDGILVNPTGVDISRAGLVAVGGQNTSAFAPAWDTASWPPPSGSGDAYVVLFDADGTHLFTRAFRGPGSDNFASIKLDDRGAVLVSGYFSGTLSVMPHGTLTAPSGTIAGFYALWDATSSFTFDARAFVGTGLNIVQGVAVDPFGGLLVAGRFQRTTELVLGSTYDSMGGGAGYLVHVADFGP